ncbi:MAG TPA: S41 family peptidase [Gemmatimonadaceae bacterium]
MVKRLTHKAFGRLFTTAVGVLLFASPLALRAQAPSATGLDIAVELASFDTVWARIQRTYYDSTMRGIDWPGVRDELRPRVERATSRAEVRAAIAAMLNRLGESHFALLPRDPMADSAGQPESRDGDVGLEVRLLDGRVLITRVDTGGPAHLAGIRTGWSLQRIGNTDLQPLLASLDEIARPRDRRVAMLRLTMRLQAMLAGPIGWSVALTMDDGFGHSLARQVTRRASPGTAVQFGSLAPLDTRFEAWRLPRDRSCVGVIRFNVFMTPVSPAFDDAMNALRSCRGIVLDLRGNVGGVAAMVMGLAGYFFDKDVTLGEVRMRGAQLKYVANPRLVNRHGERVTPYAGPVAILVDELSASTTEIFAGALQALGRARLFGSPSAGQALPSLLMPLPNGDAVMYAIADYVAPGGRRLEGQGVVPDEPIPLTRAALLQGVDAPLEAALRWLDRQGSEGNAPARGQPH